MLTGKKLKGKSREIKQTQEKCIKTQAGESTKLENTSFEGSCFH